MADGLLLSVAMVWGTSYGVTKTALLSVPVLIFLMLRFGITALLLLPSVLHEVKHSKTNLPYKFKVGFATGLVLLTIFLLEVFGVAFTKASNAAFLISLFVVFTPFVEWWLLKIKPDNQLFVVAILCLLGAGFITGGLSAPLNLGDCLIMLAGLCRAFIVVLTKKLTQKQAIGALFLTGIQSLTVWLGTLLLAILTHQHFTLPTHAEFWWSLGYLVLFCSIFAFFAQNFAINQTTPTRVSILMGTEPVFGALFAVVWLQESLSFLSWIGGLLIVGSSIYLTLQKSNA